MAGIYCSSERKKSKTKKWKTAYRAVFQPTFCGLWSQNCLLVCIFIWVFMYYIFIQFSSFYLFSSFGLLCNNVILWGKVLSMEQSSTFLKKLIMVSKNFFINKHHCDFYLLHHFLNIMFQICWFFFLSRLVDEAVYVMQCYCIALDHHVACHGDGLIFWKYYLHFTFNNQ